MKQSTHSKSSRKKNTKSDNQQDREETIDIDEMSDAITKKVFWNRDTEMKKSGISCHDNAATVMPYVSQVCEFLFVSICGSHFLIVVITANRFSILTIHCRLRYSLCKVYGTRRISFATVCSTFRT